MKETKLDLPKIIAARLVAIGFAQLPPGVVDQLVEGTAAKAQRAVEAAVTPGTVTKAFAAYAAQVKAKPAPVAAPASGKSGPTGPAK
jgi:hypothetical protein